MDGNFVGLAAVVLFFGIPMAAMYPFFRVRQLRSEERLAAIARGVDVSMQAELSEAARSRRSGSPYLLRPAFSEPSAPIFCSFSEFNF
jgi:hypothetical protein